MTIIETRIFTKQVEKLLSDDEYRELQKLLVEKPNDGAVIQGSGGLRKLRWGYGGQGKRGGVRTIYYWAVAHDQILMLLMYPKNVQGNLSPKQLKALRQIVENEY